MGRFERHHVLDTSINRYIPPSDPRGAISSEKHQIVRVVAGKVYPFLSTHLIDPARYMYAVWRYEGSRWRISL